MGTNNYLDQDSDFRDLGGVDIPNRKVFDGFPTNLEKYFDPLINICKIRAEIRNKFRIPILETTDLFSRKIPKFSFLDIAKEEEVRIKCRANKNYRMGVFDSLSRAYEDAFSYHLRKDNKQILYYEEQAKYLVKKLFRVAYTEGFDEVLEKYNFYMETSMISEIEMDHIKYEFDFEFKNFFLSKLKSKSYVEFVEGLFKFADKFYFSRDDFSSFGLTESDEKDFYDFLSVYVSNLLKLNPIIYVAVYDFFVKMGFPVDTWRKSEHMKKCAKEMILDSASKSISYLSDVIVELDDLKIFDKKEILSLPELRDILGSRLGDVIQISPDAYIQVRNYYVSLGLISKEDADNLSYVKNGLNIFLENFVSLFGVRGSAYYQHIKSLDMNVFIDSKFENEFLNDLVSVVDKSILSFMVARTNSALNADSDIEKEVFDKVREEYVAVFNSFLETYPFFNKYFKD